MTLKELVIENTKALKALARKVDPPTCKDCPNHLEMIRILNCKVEDLQLYKNIHIEMSKIIDDMFDGPYNLLRLPDKLQMLIDIAGIKDPLPVEEIERRRNIQGTD